MEIHSNGNFYKMISYLKLVRFKNLLIVALTQYLMRWGLIYPILKLNGFEFQFSEFYFFLLVLASMCITAAGYVINDYFDTKADLLNRPSTVIIDKEVDRRYAILLHWILNLIGIVLGFYISYVAGIPFLGFMFVLASGVLWFYSTTYKRQFFIGNLIVAVMTAAVPFVVVVFEIPLLNKAYGEIMLLNKANFNYIIAWVGVFSYFAFITTLTREIIKDVEDYEGDSAYGRNTLPIVLGIPKTKAVIVFLISATILSLIYLFKTYLLLNWKDDIDFVSLLYFLVFLIVPLILLLVMIVGAKSKKEYHRANILSKLIMLGGILYSLVVHYLINKIT
jgi:4-hydroxybenzoate polyprenyltransferase